MLGDKFLVEFETANHVAKVLNAAGYEAYIIGGAVRDILLSKNPKDFDLVTNATPEQIDAIPDFKDVKPVHPAQAYGVTIIRLDTPQGPVKLEITTYRRDIEAHLGRKLTKVEFAHVEDDLARRDFTINALALDPINNYLLDEVGGLRDLDKKLVRFIGNPETRINEDPLRVMRGLRFVHQLGFRFSKTTGLAIKSAVKKDILEKIATDRLRTELNVGLLLPKKKQFIELLDHMGALAKLLPEVVAGSKVLQPPDMHAEGDVLTHTKLAIGYLPDDAELRLIWATLLHDIGKPPTIKYPEHPGDRIRFNEHFRVGAAMAEKILQRLNFSKKFTKDVCWMIEHHLGIDDLPQMTPSHQNSMMNNPAFADLMELHRADARASWAIKANGTLYKPNPKFTKLQKLWKKFQHVQSKPMKTLKSELGIDGNWLKQSYGYRDGKQLGIILEYLNAAYLNGEILSLADAKRLINKMRNK